MRRKIIYACLLLATVLAITLLAVTGSQISFTLGTTPGNPAGGKISIWANTATGNLECLTSGGLLGCIANASITGTPSVSGTALTMVGPRMYGYCTGTCTVAIPVPPAAGTTYEFCILNDDNVATAITLSAIGSSAMYENSARTAYGTAGTGTLVIAAAAANKVCIMSRDTTHYLTVSNNGGAITVN